MSNNIAAIQRHRVAWKARRKLTGQKRRVPLMVAERVWYRAGGICELCGVRHGREFHHIRPVSEGGQHNIYNVCLLCHGCHVRQHAHEQVDPLKPVRGIVRRWNLVFGMGVAF